MARADPPASLLSRQGSDRNSENDVKTPTINSQSPWSSAAALGLLPAALVIQLLLGGCVGHKLYNVEPDQYLRTFAVKGGDDSGGVEYDLCIVEFDDHGTFWKREQLEAAIDRIRQRNNEADQGVLVIPYVHGWKNNADPDREESDLTRFRDELNAVATQIAQNEPGRPNRVVGVYLAWRGASSSIPIHKQATFWPRRMAGERVASINMREAMFRIMAVTRERDESKCFIVGHSMGGMIVGKTLAPSVTTLVLTGDTGGSRMPADFVVMLNPALDALASWQFIDFLKRANARLELRYADGRREPAPGPLIVSITSESDGATGAAYTFGRTTSSLFTAFRNDHSDPQPSQRYMATRAEGHVDYLLSHRAYVKDGKAILERIEGAFNDTPFWVIQVSSEISKNHGDTRNPILGKLIADLSQMNKLYENDVETWMVTGDDSR